MTQNLFLSEMHPVSRRFAELEDDGTSAWLYLTEPNTRRVVADAWVYNRVAPPRPEEANSFRPTPPPAALGFAIARALCASPERHEWGFAWSDDGGSVAVTKDGQAVACIIAGNKRGYSRELVRDGPWGNAWSDAAFARAFGPDGVDGPTANGR